LRRVRKGNFLGGNAKRAGRSGSGRKGPELTQPIAEIGSLGKGAGRGSLGPVVAGLKIVSSVTEGSGFSSGRSEKVVEAGRETKDQGHNRRENFLR